MEKIKWILLMMLFFVQPVFGQKYFFKQEYIPNSEYEIISKSLIKSSNSLTNEKGNMEILLERKYLLSTQTEKDDKIPFSLIYSITDSNIKINGLEKPTRKTLPTTEIVGEIFEKNRLITQKNTSDPQYQKQIEDKMSLFEMMKIEFPKRGVFIGERFTQKVPILIDRMETIILEFQLSRVIEGKAFFDIIKIEMENRKYKDVKGKGKAELDIEGKYFSMLETEIEIQNTITKNSLSQKKLK